jgi:hypothetical protein
LSGLQGAFRKVTAEADACAKDMTATLRGRLQGNAGDAAECIQLMRQLGEPIENLQVRPHMMAQMRSVALVCLTACLQQQTWRWAHILRAHCMLAGELTSAV